MVRISVRLPGIFAASHLPGVDAGLVNLSAVLRIANLQDLCPSRRVRSGFDIRQGASRLAVGWGSAAERVFGPKRALLDQRGANAYSAVIAIKNGAQSPPAAIMSSAMISASGLGFTHVNK